MWVLLLFMGVRLVVGLLVEMLGVVHLLLTMGVIGVVSEVLLGWVLREVVEKDWADVLRVEHFSGEVPALSVVLLIFVFCLVDRDGNFFFKILLVGDWDVLHLVKVFLSVFWVWILVFYDVVEVLILHLVRFCLEITLILHKSPSLQQLLPLHIEHLSILNNPLLALRFLDPHLLLVKVLQRLVHLFHHTSEHLSFSFKVVVLMLQLLFLFH